MSSQVHPSSKSCQIGAARTQGFNLSVQPVGHFHLTALDCHVAEWKGVSLPVFWGPSREIKLSRSRWAHNQPTQADFWVPVLWKWGFHPSLLISALVSVSHFTLKTGSLRACRFRILLVLLTAQLDPILAVSFTNASLLRMKM